MTPEGTDACSRRRCSSSRASVRGAPPISSTPASITIEDLLYRFPHPLRRSQPPAADRVAEARPDRRRSPDAFSAAACARPGVPASRSSKRLVDDGSGSLRAVVAEPAVSADVFARGQHVVLYGPVEMRGTGGLQLTNPQYEILDEEDGETIHTGRIVPVYEKTGTVTPKMQRRLVFDALQRLPTDLPDPLPEAMRLRLGLPSRVRGAAGGAFSAGGRARSRR